MAPASGKTDFDVMTEPVGPDADAAALPALPARVPPQPDLEALLRENPWSVQFFQAVRLLQLLRRDRQAVGGFAHPEREAVRFRVNPELVFPPSQIHALSLPENGTPEMTVNFFGLVGSLGVLPIPYSEYVLSRRRAKDTTALAFFDIFHHRLLSLFYRAWEKYRFPVAYERDGRDRVSRLLASLVGLGTPGLERRQSVADESLLFYTGLLSLQPRSAQALSQVLEDYFGVPAEVQQFVGGWYPLRRSDRCDIGGERDYAGQLGRGAVAGDAVWDRQSRARVRLGPLSRDEYEGFLPGGPAHEPLRALVRFFARDEIEFEAQLILRRGDVPPCGLDTATPVAEAAPAPRLGWTTWVKSQPDFPRDPEDTVLVLT